MRSQGKVGFGLWKGDIEICGCLSLCFVKVGGQHVFEHCTSPLVLKALAYEEECFLLVAMDGINDGFMVTPRKTENVIDHFAPN